MLVFAIIISSKGTNFASIGNFKRDSSDKHHLHWDCLTLLFSLRTDVNACYKKGMGQKRNELILEEMGIEWKLCILYTYIY